MTAEIESRLIPLTDGRQGVRSTIQTEVREIGEQSCTPCLDFIASDETLDRYGEVITASGWRLDSYNRNPVFQNSHQYGDILFTLGKALITEVRDGKLYQRIEFATDVNPMARLAYGLYKGKFLNAVSVGFVPLRWEDAPKSSSLAAPKSDVGGSSIRRRYLEQELLEVSAVAIPANPSALALGLKSGAVEKADVKELAHLLRLILADPPGVRMNKNGLDSSHAQLVRLLRELRSVLNYT